jgi:hypothetical protein
MLDMTSEQMEQRILELEEQLKLTSLEVATMKAPGPPSSIKLAIGLPLVDKLSDTSFWRSFIPVVAQEVSRVIKEAQKAGSVASFELLWPRMPCGKDMDEIRNSLAMQALESDCTHIVMMDTDQVYPSDTLTRLIAHAEAGFDIVCAKVHRRYPPFDPLLLRNDTEKQYRFLTMTIADWYDKGLVEVDATGTGCMMISCKVFEKVPWPWFKTVKKDISDTEFAIIGEDVGFCQKAKAAGYKIFVDTTIKVGHLADIVVTEELHFLFCKMEELRARKGA